MTEQLSPAAQAVLDAYDNSPFDDDIGDRVAIAAALRAAADCIGHATSARALYAIATELEGAN